MAPTYELELVATIETYSTATLAIEARSTATLATDLAALMESGGPRDPQTWLSYHVIIDTLCKCHPEVEAAWEAWADVNEHLPARERVLADTAILPVVRALTEDPTFALVRDGEIWSRFTDIDAAWRSADWCTAHYPGVANRVIDIRTGDDAQRVVPDHHNA